MTDGLHAAVGWRASRLTVMPGLMPFALNDAEKDFKPDDWAWEFLRLQPGYRDAFERAVQRQEDEPSARKRAHQSREQHPYRRILVDEMECRTRFGLSTWLSPEEQKLPALEPGQSWFSPLTRVVEWPETLSGFFLPEGVFGYCGHSQSPPASRIRVPPRGASSAVWFAVDCSVPPDGQLDTIAFVAGQFAAQLRNAGFTSKSFSTRRLVVLPLKEHDDFDGKDYQMAAAPAETVTDLADLWRLIRVDILGAAGEQLDRCRRILQKQHRLLWQSGLAAPPERERFRFELSSAKAGPDGTRPSYGHALKAYAVLAQCYLAGISDPEELHKLVFDPFSATAGRTPNKEWINWEVEFPRRVPQYIEQARRYVRGGYKWLIHAQKP